MRLWLYLGVCAVFPALWGFALGRVFDSLDRRRQLAEIRDRLPPTDYSI